ncbi:adenosine kinase [Microbulbifer thermotolerans]|uniref:Adenosine kinase n=1 Tax=Microbulbifer thermotolerans TaxID=252514 RepID=A0A143HIK8_MICTH|nr:adenosine kinase [Microbulbifer thermotolerans]AMX01549.1 sugar kinase [Microbulbifer thermotolerans]MCX2778402.1 adenosine kinase [Microbulbifer thermotolerans]MCX2784180.1 adenosine kinase [Microbulbifer thermotolerans]MCX2796171.1 adenosine kinase [Microbulbifer thermotolerans]MCX2803038.1 adenosine kinase [Microbulbifer thermotolerans]
MHQYDLYGIGAALLDTEIEVTDKDLQKLGVEKGVMTLVDDARQRQLVADLEDHLVTATRACGGSGANTVIAASYFGLRTFYSCKVAADDNGDFYLANLASAGVDYPDALDEAVPGTTGKCLVLVTPDAERSMNTYLGISEQLSTTELDIHALAASRWAYIEGYLVSSETGRAAAIALREQAEKAGVKTALSLSDPAMVQLFRDGLGEMIGDGVDMLFCNRDEALGFTETNSLDDAAAALQRHCRSFAITLGAEGALLWDGERQHRVSSPKVHAIDTNGAGDMFAGAFLYGINRDMPFAEAGELACRAAAQVVSQYGPRLRAEQHAELLAAVV